MFTNPSTDEIRDLLKTVKSIAVVGLSDNPARPSYRVAKAMQALGYRIIPVRPAQSEVLGEKAHAQLTDLPGDNIAPDLVDVFRNPEAVDEIVDQCIAIGAKRLWLQEGVVNEPAAARARAAGIVVVMDRCVWKDAAALL
ncbi:MAG: CoA-binding protein [Gammaproteobacteria bacterium]|nr:CoA-binding protein [Gammaproteobacteria bacterium]MBU1645053.1 CoA-binding protein [Gammaproteobacteria bacterium]MBU1973290.1 CoA-binding protein [Gammaproteobacteria bacterium]